MHWLTLKRSDIFLYEDSFTMILSWYAFHLDSDSNISVVRNMKYTGINFGQEYLTSDVTTGELGRSTPSPYVQTTPEIGANRLKSLYIS